MNKALPVEDLQELGAGRWRGKVKFPNRVQPTSILIFALDGGWVGLRAHCPHKGHDLADCTVTEAGTLVCQRHGLALSLRGYLAFRLTRREESFAVTWPLTC